MLAEIGQFTLAIGMMFSLLLAVFPLYGYFTQNDNLMHTARPLAYMQFIFMLVSFLILVTLFVLQDFTVQYVWQNSNSVLPIRYRISATWGAHEGSMLLWVMIQTLWTAFVAFYSKSLSRQQVARILAVLGIITLGFAAFVYFMSNPFLRTLPAPIDGRDLNPLLQDIGLIIHPPILYMGYVGLSIPFAIAVAALIGGKIDENWIRWSRPWTNAAWGFLTLGIVLGSWWAYYELGWGGWWFWDPVENASFLPWLAVTALIHVQAVSEKRNAFRGWTVLLAILGFSLSVLGTFLVRSGTLTSVHAFASDPERGIFVLSLLAIYAGGALFLYALRVNKLKSKIGFELSSKETLLLTNSIIFFSACFLVLWGTLFPLIAEAFGYKMSIGAPYFGSMFFLIMVPMAIFLPFGMMYKWRKDEMIRVTKLLAPLLIISVILTVLSTWYFDLHKVRSISYLFNSFQINTGRIKAITGIFGAYWVLLSVLYYFISYKGQLTRAVWGMQISHFGVAIFIFGVTMTEHTDFEIDSLMHPNETKIVKDYSVQFLGVEQKQIENYQANIGHFTVSKGGNQIASLEPQKRIYPRGGNPMTEAAIDPGFTRDLYISLGEQINNQGGWAVRIYVKPYIRWMWGGGILMMLGGFWAATDRRYFRHAKQNKQKNIETYLAT